MAKPRPVRLRQLTSGLFASRSPRTTQRLAQRLAATLKPGDVLALTGNLGAGKTCFVQGLVASLPGGDRAEPRSPTFALLNAYPTEPPVYHFDFYRLNGIEDLETTGYWDCLQGRDGIAVVEWADHIPAAVPATAVRVHLAVEEDGTRRIRVEDGRVETAVP